MISDVDDDGSGTIGYEELFGLRSFKSSEISGETGRKPWLSEDFDVSLAVLGDIL